MLTADGGVKRNLHRLAQIYADQTDIPLGQLPLTASHLSDAGSRETLVGNILRYQKNRLAAQAAESLPLFVGSNDVDAVVGERRFRPAALLSPALYVEGDGRDHEANLAMLEAACRLGFGKELLAQIVFSGSLLSRPEAITVARDYASMPVLGFFIWPVGLSEREMVADREQFERYVEFIQVLSQHGRPVWQLNGGLTAALLWNAGLTGFAHRLTARDNGGQVLPPPPMTRSGRWLYWPRAGQEVRFEAIREVAKQWDPGRYLALFCDCSVCAGAMAALGMASLEMMVETEFRESERREVPTDAARRYNQGHLIGVRHAEAALGLQPPSTIADRLSEHAAILERCTDTRYLRRLSRRMLDVEAVAKKRSQPELQFTPPKAHRKTD
jgi:hypothetical protein